MASKKPRPIVNLPHALDIAANHKRRANGGEELTQTEKALVLVADRIEGRMRGIPEPCGCCGTAPADPGGEYCRTCRLDGQQGERS